MACLKVPVSVQNAFHRNIPKGWHVESVQFLPYPGWDCDLYVCRITDGINVRYMESDHGAIKQTTKKALQKRLKAYRNLLEVGEAWLS